MEKENIFMNSIISHPPPSLNYTGLQSSSSSSSLAQPNWHSSLRMEGQLEEINCSSNQFLNVTWENSMDQSGPFESAMSSFISSPSSVANSAVPADSVVVGALIERLGGLCNSSRGLSQLQMVSTNSIDTSCHSTSLNSPPKLELLMMDHQIRGNLPTVGNSMASSFAPFTTDPEFPERAAKFSCFGSSSIGGLMGQLSLLGTEGGNPLGVSSSQSLRIGPQMGGLVIKDGAIQKRLDADMRAGSSGSAPDRKFSRLSRSSTPDDSESRNARVEAAAAVAPEPSSKGPNDTNARKRKAKAKEQHSSQVTADDNPSDKRCKAAEAVESGKDVKVKSEQGNDSNVGSGGKNQNKDSKPPEPPKQDYIHVRARRGQATDSHSLAERVRRERINERMKFLQDLVPGCDKVTGKAVMLDEIINYVQSLQRQVEFLSMKLAHVNPRLDFNMEALLSKDILQSHGSLPQTLYPLDSSVAASMFSYSHQPQQVPLQTDVSTDWKMEIH